MVENAKTPEILGRYELLTRLATGGMAELFLAREHGLAGLERLVVIKRILPHLADQPSFVDMFLREARIVARLSHPNVVQIYELGHEADSYHIAMEYIHGSTVRELLLLTQEAERSMPLQVIVSIVEQACRGLHAAHALKDLEGNPLGLVHRDISPHNLMCTSEGNVKLLDFGVAKSTAASVEATYSGNLKGKFAYLSPEQCLHEPLDRRSDIFAMGIVIWEMCTMRRLFKRRTELEMMQAVIGGKVPPPQKFREELPLPIQEVVLKALATDRDDRYATAEDMRMALTEAAQKSGLTFGEDRVAEFLEEVAGEKLAERRETVSNAFERALTATERNRLLHMTGTHSKSLAESFDDFDDDAATVVERPGGGETKSTQQTPSHELEELIQGDRRSDQNDDPVRARTIRIAIIAVATVALGALALTAWNQGNQSDEGDGPAVVAVDEEEDEEEGGEGEELIELPAVETSGEPLAMGWAPTVDPAVLQVEVEPLHRYLEIYTGRPVPLVMSEDYSDLAQMLLNGEIALAVLPPRLFVDTKDMDDAIEILALKEFDGSVYSDALLLVHSDSAVRQLADLEGKTFCFVDPMSTSGNFLPRQYIRDRGYEPDEFIGGIHWSGDHFQGMRDLSDGLCDAAAVYSGAFLSGDEFGIRTGRIRNLAVTGFIPQDTVTAGSHVSEEDRNMLREALLSFDPMNEFGVERLGRNQRITGFAAGENEVFDNLRDVMSRAAEQQ